MDKEAHIHTVHTANTHNIKTWSNLALSQKPITLYLG